MKIIEMIDRVQSIYSKGVASDDSRLSNRNIYSKLMSVRSVLIAQKARKKQKLSRWGYQVLPCVEMVKAPIHECPCIPVPGCQIMRSKFKLPKPIEGFSPLIDSVTSIDGSVTYEPTTFKKKKHTKGNKYTGKTSDYYIRNEYLYITNTDLRSPVVVTIEGLFEDPVEVEKFTSYCENNSEENIDNQCKAAYELEFPIDADLVERLIEFSYNENVQLFRQGIEDQTNNSNDNITQQSK